MGLQYQTQIVVSGQQVWVVESYESIFAQLRAANFKMSDLEDGSGEYQWAEPLEVTMMSTPDGGPPMRAAIQPHAISFVIEIPPENRRDVDLPAARDEAA